MTPHFEVVANVLLQACYHICLGMPYLRIFAIVTLLGAMTDKWVLNFVFSR